MPDITKQDLNELGDSLREAMVAGFSDVHHEIAQIKAKQEETLTAIDSLAGQVETLTQEGAAQLHHNRRIDERFERVEQHIGLPPFTESLRA
ncbi:MAG: hypothetical protein AAFR71_16785 [Pseudomonadota bacterium]